MGTVGPGVDGRVPGIKLDWRQEMSLEHVSKSVLTFFLIACAIWLGISWKFYSEALASIFFACSLASVLVIHLRVSPSGRDVLLVLFGALLFAAIDFQVLHYKPTFASWLSFAGLSSLATMGVRTIWATGVPRRMLSFAFVPSVLFVTSEYFASTFLQWTASAHPKILDLYLYSFDASLGLQIPFLVGQRFVAWPWLLRASLLFYIGLPIPIAMVYAGRLLRLREKALPSYVALLATGPVGVLFYNLFPALGPVHIFPKIFPLYPLPTPSVSRLHVEPVAIAGTPNAIPSLHLAWMLLAWWYSRGLSWAERSIAFSFLLFTVLATLGTGEHYFVDLIVAFPFALLMEALCAFSLSWKNKTRLAAGIGGLCLVLGWFAALHYATHFFWTSRLVPWMVCFCTVIFSVVFELRLHGQAERTAAVDQIHLAALVSVPTPAK